ncbi:hypothetical protein [Pseudactinotalea sp.]|uniref:hypothetical protein n=1 Tax=Pseudactinotalea sp. TaxID=1926260 RepID=UPI003B3ABD7D
MSTGGDPSEPYGAVGRERNGGEGTRAPRSLQWHPGGPVVVRPNKFLTAGYLLAAVVLVVVLLTQDLGLPFVWWLLGALLVFLLIVVAETLVGEVRVDNLGITRRSLRGTRSYGREDLDLPVLHTYMRSSRSGRHPVLRLTIRRLSGRYGFQLTSDLYSADTVDRLAGLVNAVRVSDPRPADVEARYPGSTRPWQRHPVLFVITVMVVTVVVSMVAVTVSV